MHILCDTCTILMLIRIVPDMFTDEKYGCVTIPEVRKEIFRTQKFKTKYPWRDDYRSHIVTGSATAHLTADYNQRHSMVRLMLDHGIEDQETGKLFDLSPVDQKIVALAITHGWKVGSEDRPIIRLLNQEFRSSFGGDISALELINEWLANKLIVWDEMKQAYLEEWYTLGEPPQSAKEKKRFAKLTKYKYVGS